MNKDGIEERLRQIEHDEAYEPATMFAVKYHAWLKGQLLESLDRESKLESRGRDLEKALKFYADRANHRIPEPQAVEGALATEWVHYPSTIYVDSGHIARLALKEVP